MRTALILFLATVTVATAPSQSRLGAGAEPRAPASETWQPLDRWLETAGRPFPTESWTIVDGCLEYDLKQPEVAAALRSLRTQNGKQPGLEVLHESPISLQNHGGGVWFRRLQVRRLP